MNRPPARLGRSKAARRPCSIRVARFSLISTQLGRMTCFVATSAQTGLVQQCHQSSTRHQTGALSGSSRACSLLLAPLDCLLVQLHSLTIAKDLDQPSDRKQASQLCRLNRLIGPPHQPHNQPFDCSIPRQSRSTPAEQRSRPATHKSHRPRPNGPALSLPVLSPFFPLFTNTTRARQTVSRPYRASLSSPICRIFDSSTLDLLCASLLHLALVINLHRMFAHRQAGPPEPALCQDLSPLLA